MSAADAGFVFLTGPLFALIFFPFAGRFVGWIGVRAAMLLGLALLVAAAVVMVSWSATTPIWLVIATLVINGAGISITLVSSADDALAQFSAAEAGTGSALFNSVRQLGAAMGVAVPAVAFEALAGGSRGSAAALAGSTAAFGVRLAVLALPLVLVLAVWARGVRASP
jgi:DHA2 family methylenomycin A resistance protein-like MFS transporter